MYKHAQGHTLEAARPVGAQERGFEVLTELDEFTVADLAENAQWQKRT